MTDIIDSLVHLMMAIMVYIHWRNRPWVQHISRKIIKDRRLGKLGLCSIWCDVPGTTCSCRRKRS
jgi:hypothetical protein